LGTRNTTNAQTEATAEDENEEGLVNWDWIGDDSPMVSGSSESEWLIERLVESLVRLERRREGRRERAMVGGVDIGRDVKDWGNRRNGKEDGVGAVGHG